MLFAAGETEVTRYKSSMLPTYVGEDENIHFRLEWIDKIKNTFKTEKRNHSLYFTFVFRFKTVFNFNHNTEKACQNTANCNGDAQLFQIIPFFHSCTGTMDTVLT